MNPRIALITDDPGWHGARLRKAFTARGYDMQIVSLKDCAIDLHHSRYGLQIPGFETAMPDGVFVRGVPGGTLEQVVLYLDVLHALNALNVPVYNTARTIERTVDKGMTSLLLQQAGIPVPPTWVVSSAEQGQLVWQRERAAGNSLVVKPLFGSQGQGLQRLSPHQMLPALEDFQGVYYLQRYVENAGFDWRVFVINNKVVARMKRHGKHWINNVAQGASCTPSPADDEMDALAEASAATLSLDYAGVDLMRDSRGRLQVIEVNSIPAWKGLQSTCEIDIAGQLVDDFHTRYLMSSTIRVVGA
jgi:RimK family alpha-L-glutamate ligase